MPAERPFNKHYRSMQGGLRPLDERRSPIDVTSYPQVRDHLKRTIPDFKARFGKYDNILQDWQIVRLEISDLRLNENFSREAAQKVADFQAPYDDPTDERYDPEILFKLQPALSAITNLIAKTRR